MHITTNAIGSTNLFYFTDSLDRIVIARAVNGLEFTLLEGEFELLGTLFRYLFEVSRFGKALRRVKYLTTADACAPDTNVVRVFEFGKVSIKAMCVEIVHFFFTAEVAVACQRDDFHIGTHYQESHIEAHLVIARTSRSMGNSVSTNFFGIASNGHTLEDTFRRYGDRVDVVAQYVAKHHILEALLIVFVCNVECDVLCSAQLVGILFVRLELFFAEAARVGASSINFVSFFFGQIHNRV